MKITYAIKHRWRKDSAVDPITLFGKSEQKKLKHTLNKLKEHSEIDYKFEPLDKGFFEWWTPMYEERINSKDNPKIFDVEHATLNNPKSGRKYFSLTISENGEHIGGVVFSTNTNTLYFAYRTIIFDWKTAKLRAAPSLLAEYLLARHAHQLGLKIISHGIDRNPYGINSGIGLAAFKLSTGCSPELTDRPTETASLDTNNVTRDIFVMKCPEEAVPGARITKAYLIADSAGIEKWQSLLKYEDKLSVEVIERK